MTTYLMPCHKCLSELRSICEFHKCKRDILRQSGFTKATFKCPYQKDFFFPGLQVGVYLRLLDPDEYKQKIYLQGTIMGIAKSGKIKIWLEGPGVYENRVREVVTLWPNRLQILWCKPFKKVCPECGCPEGKVNHVREDKKSGTFSDGAFDCSICKTGYFNPEIQEKLANFCHS